jgi:hypothetical protein
MLCRAVPCCAVLCRAVPCCAVLLCCAMLCAADACMMVGQTERVPASTAASGAGAGAGAGAGEAAPVTYELIGTGDFTLCQTSVLSHFTMCHPFTSPVRGALRCVCVCVWCGSELYPLLNARPCDAFNPSAPSAPASASASASAAAAAAAAPPAPAPAPAPAPLPTAELRPAYRGCSFDGTHTAAQASSHSLHACAVRCLFADGTICMVCRCVVLCCVVLCCVVLCCVVLCCVVLC